MPTAAVATRWKTQLNENAKIPAFAAELPEADHNEIVGWQDASTLCSFTAVFLEDVDQHPRVRQRIELTAALIEPQAAGALRLESVGSNPVERLLSLVMLGDLVSIYLAVLRGIDPTPVEPIDRLKAALCARRSRLSRQAAPYTSPLAGLRTPPLQMCPFAAPLRCLIRLNGRSR